MDEIAQSYKQLEQNFLAWAGGQENIRAAVVIGSRARTDHPADEWADLDIILLVNDMQPYVEDATWVEQIGEVWLTFVERTGDGNSWERRVLYAGGYDVDFAFIPTAWLSQLDGPPPDAANSFGRGFRVLLDKDGIGPRLRLDEVHREPPPPPAAAEFLNVVNDFWYHTLWSAKHLRRGEIWWAKGCVDGHLKWLLQCMLEWHAQASRPGTDTWLRGRFFEELADTQAVQALGEAFARYNAEDIWRALFRTIEIFERVSRQTAQLWDIPYPDQGAANAGELTRKLFAERETNAGYTEYTEFVG
jgi:aminoglycoside 6-adenylyltransferase